MKSLFFGFKPAIAWFVLSFILLILPGSAFPKENWLSKIFFDKWVHIGMFAVLVWLFCRGVFYTKDKIFSILKIFIGIAVLCFLYGVVMEYVQENYIPNRSFDTGDIIADGVGSAMGCLISYYWYKKIDLCRNRGRNQN
jgi:VanZ family protein